MLATHSSTSRAAPTATVAELQDDLADQARGHHDLTVPAGQLRYDSETGMIEVQGQREYGLRPLALRACLTTWFQSANHQVRHREVEECNA
jgi:hypothetical protein